MDTSAATLDRPRPQPVCACPPNALHSAWDLAPRAAAPHDPACPVRDARRSADGAEQNAAGVSPDLWLG